MSRTFIPNYYDLENAILPDDVHDESMIIKSSQHLPTEFMDGLKRERDNSKNQTEGEFMRVASVPVAVYEQWLREGFDMMKEDPKAILKRLKQQDLDSFITTKKQV